MTATLDEILFEESLATDNTGTWEGNPASALNLD